MVSVVLSLIGGKKGMAQSAANTGNIGKVRLTHLGAAGWEITDGKTVILVDPYLSRIRYYGPVVKTADAPGDTRPVFGPDDLVVPDTTTIDAHIKRADFILVHHSHFDHMMDVPYIARKTGASIVGTESTANIARAYGVPDEKLIIVRGGEDYEFSDFSLKVIPSIHTVARKHYIRPGIVPRDIKPPLRIRDFVEGGSLAYFVRLGGHQILTFGSMNYIEREIEGLRPDVALVGAGQRRLEIYDYTGRLIRALGYPPLVIPTHWDDYGFPYQASQEEAIQRLESFVNEVKTVSPKTRVVIPKYFEPITLEPRGE